MRKSIFAATKKKHGFDDVVTTREQSGDTVVEVIKSKTDKQFPYALLWYGSLPGACVVHGRVEFGTSWFRRTGHRTPCVREDVRRRYPVKWMEFLESRIDALSR